MEGSCTDTCCTDGSTQEPKPRTARNKPTTRKAYKEMPNKASINSAFWGKAMDGETDYVRALMSLELRSQDPKNSTWTFNEYSSGENLGQTGFVDTAEGGARREATFQRFTKPRATEWMAAARDAAEHEAVEQRRLRFLSETSSFAEVEAAFLKSCKRT